MARVGNSIIKGIEVGEIITKLNRAYADEWLKQSHCGYDAPSDFDVVSILKDAIKGEQCAIATYSDIVDMTRNKDIVTYDMVSQILADEVEHEEDLQSLHDDIAEFISEIKKSIQ